MDSILREKLVSQAQRLGAVGGLYRTDSSRFVNSYYDWLESAEKDLANLRSPFSALIQAEKAKVTSVLDGYRPDYIIESRSARRCQRAVAAKSVSDLSQEMYKKIDQIDTNFYQLQEKISHSLAVLANKEPDVFSGLKISEASALIIWARLAQHPETLPMYNYLSVKLAAVDRKYLLLDALQNTLGRIGEQASDELASITAKGDGETVKIEQAQGQGPLEIVLTGLLNTFMQLKLQADSFSALLDVGATPAARRDLAKATQVDESDITVLTKCADLQRITGVSFPLAYILLLSGVDSVVELSRRNADKLVATTHAVVDEHGYEIPPPQGVIMKAWIEEAKTLPRRLSF